MKNPTDQSENRCEKFVSGKNFTPSPAECMNFASELERELDALAFAAARVEWKYGRTDDGKPKNWKEWNDLRECLGDRLRQPQELGGEQ